jgi:Protein of unknown function (DUF2934)
MTDNPLEMTAEREARIRQRAYYLWEQEGRPHGRDVDFWERARALIGMEEHPTAGQMPVSSQRTPRVEGAEPQANLGEVPNPLTDQGDRPVTPAGRQRRGRRGASGGGA